MNILVLGCNGMAGHLISLYFKEKGHKVTGFARQKSTLLEHTVVGDATDLNLIKTIVNNGEFDAVINCIGLLNQFAEDNKSSAVLLNGYLPHYLVELTTKTPTRIIHMSTDCVFSGNDGPYYENSFPNGHSFYDRTKAIGEINTVKDLTFRNSIIGPDIKQSGIGLFNWFMKQEGSISGFTGAIWTGVTTLTLAQAMESALESNLSGLYNLVNNTSISKYELLCLFNKYFRDNEIQIIPNGNLKVDKSIRSTRTDFPFTVQDYEKQIVDLKEWMISHKYIYPHYAL